MSPRIHILSVVIGLLLGSPIVAAETIKGIYLDQKHLEDRVFIKQTIAQAKKYKINAFIVDLDKITHSYEKNVSLMNNHGIIYIARITLYPKGHLLRARHMRVHWMQQSRLIEAAIGLGAKSIYVDDQKGTSLVKQQRVTWFHDKVKKRTLLQFAFNPDKEHLQAAWLQNLGIHTVTPIQAFLPHNERSQQFLKIPLLEKKSAFMHPHTMVVLIPAEIQQTAVSHVKAVEAANLGGWYLWSEDNAYRTVLEALSQKTHH